MQKYPTNVWRLESFPVGFDAFHTPIKLLVQLSFSILEMLFENLSLERNEKSSTIGKLTKTTQFR